MHSKMHAYIMLPHPWPVLVVLIATAAFGWLAAGGAPNPTRYALLLAGMLGGQLAIGALNEWRDRHADAAAKPWKPIPAGLVSPRAALGVVAGGLALMLVAGALLGGPELAVLALGTGAGLTYDLGIKRTPLSWLPYLVALPLLPTWAWLVMDRFEPRLLWLYPVGALLTVAIHLAQVMPDIQWDRRLGERGLAVALGERRSTVLLWTTSFASAALVAAGAAWLGQRPLAGLVAAGVVAVVLLVALARSLRDPARVQRRLFQILTASAVVLGCGWTIAVVS